MSARLHLRFEIAGDPYLLPATSILSVRPLPALKALPGAPEGVAGVALHEGRPIPALDLARLAGGAGAADRLSTRLVVVAFPAPGGSRPLGLIVERAVGVSRVDPAALASAGAPGAPWLGGLAQVAAGDAAKERVVPAQVIEVAELVPADLRAVLFAAVEEELAP